MFMEGLVVKGGQPELCKNVELRDIKRGGSRGR